ncbi:actin cytoskeleton-regulatory complex protein pan1-like [Nicotiana tomentosiformis]|uniref:actin cytoskeleton-regulatory complex protein pan1-like n=1 Tax=Nicotiana tomentosiformis TaxID=4098 RepID=UPI00388C87C6
MAKTSKTVPQKENASSSRSAGDKTPVEPRPEECVLGVCVLTSDFKIDKASSVPGRYESVSSLGKDAVMRPLSGEEETSIPAPKLTKDKKRKKISTSEDQEPKKKAVRKLRKNIILLTEDSVQRLRDEDEEEEDDSGLVARVKMSTEAPKATESVKAAEIPSRDEGVSGRELVEVPESSRFEATPHHNEPMVGTAVGAGLEAPQDGENAPSDSLGAIEIGGSPLLPSFSEEMIREARALNTLSIEGGHGREDPFRDYFTRVEDATGLSDLEVPRKDSGEASSLFNEVQQALNRASVLHPEVFSRSRAELSRVKEKSSSQEKKIVELEARLASELEKAKSEVEKAKAEADAIVAVYRADAEAAQAKELEVDDGALASDDDDDDDESKSGSESGEELDGQEMEP